MTNQAAGVIAIWTAEVFATAAHAAVGQRRKYTNAPYIEHPRAVVGLVKTVENHTCEMVCAAWLHDVLEDTQVTSDVLDSIFGAVITTMVMALTDVGHEHGNRKTRKALDRERLARAPAGVQTIKVADLIDNTPSIVANDPDFARVYVREKRELLDVLAHADPGLWCRADDMVNESLKTLC